MVGLQSTVLDTPFNSVNSALKEPSISKAIAAAQNLVRHFRRRELENTKLKRKQQQIKAYPGRQNEME